MPLSYPHPQPPPIFLLLLFLIKHRGVLRMTRSDKAMFHRAYIWTTVCEHSCMWKVLWLRARMCVCVLLWRDRISSTDPWNPHFSFVVVFFVSLDMSNGLCSEILWKAQQKGKSKTKGGNYFGKIGIDLEKITIWFKTKIVLTKFSLWNWNHHQFLRKKIRTISKHKPDMKTLKCVLWKFCALHLMLKL